MELKRYIEKDSKTALEKIRHLHGDNALIVSTEKVGNKIEVIVGVEEIKDDLNRASSPRTDQTVSLNSTNGKVREKESTEKDPWKFVDELNKEIGLIKEQIASFSGDPKVSSEPDIDAIDREIKANGHVLDPVESCLCSAGVYLVAGSPGSGKSTVIEKIISQARSKDYSQVRGEITERTRINPKSERTHSFSCIESIEQLRSFISLGSVYDQILVETDLQSFTTPTSFLHECDDNITRVVCIPMDQDSANIKKLLQDLTNIDAILVLTRLDLCTNLPHKLELILESNKKIFGTSTGAY